MSSPSDENDLAKQYYVTLILRLMLDQHGQLIHGEIVDATNTLQKRFIGRNGLIGAVQDWLSQREETGTTDGTRKP